MTEEKNHVDTAQIEEMFKVGAHFGYSRARRHSSVKGHLYGAKNGADIINLEDTQRMLAAAKARMFELGKLGKVVLFVGTKDEVRGIVESVAHSVNAPYVNERWVGGMLTNWNEIKKRIARLKDLSDKFAKGDLGKYTKKERLLFEREMAKLHAEFGGVSGLEGIPGALVIVDPRAEHIAVTEAKKMRVETFAILNSDCNKDEINYPILANDSALKSVTYFLEELKESYQEGVRARA